MNTKGRVTIPTDMDAVPETLDLLKRWGADAIRDCDGTEFPQELKDTGAKIYATYYTTRKDNAWAKANPDETQQCYIMTPFYTAADGALTIPLMTGISRELMKVNDHDDIARWWEVIDRTTGEPLDAAAWHYDAATESVVIDAPAAYHEYTVSFLAYLIWDPVHMYNSVINDWKDVEHQIPFDVRQPKTHAYTMRRLREYLESHPYVNVVRFTTFFHLFTLVFDELRREKYVDWYGYSASVSPYILDQFEKEVGYKFRPEFIIDQGYYNNQYRVPTKEYKDFQAFQRREVAGLMKEMTDIVHAYGKEAMMFLGDHWIGCEPFMPEFQQSGVDAIVGSVGNGSTLRLISDIPGVKYTEGRFLPYFFPDTFHEGGDPVREAKENWVTARRAILRKPIDRIGYGGYLKLACEFPEFLDYVESVCNEFRELYENIKGTTPYCVKTVAVLNSWGQQRAWGCHMVHHALYQKQNYSYAGVIEALSGAPFDVRFISFDDIKADPKVLDGIDVLINVGDGDTAHTGGKVWEDPDVSSAVKGFVHRGGFGGVGRKRPRADDGVIRVGVHVGVGGEIHIEAVGTQVAANGLPHGTGGVGTLGSHGGGALIPGQVEGIFIGQPRHRAALLVHRDKQWDVGGLLQGRVEGGDLFRVHDVFAELAHAAHGILLQRVPHGVGQLGHAVRLGVVDLLLRQGQIQGIRPDNEQLADLLFKSHAGKQRVHGVRLRISAGDLRRVARLYYYLGAARVRLDRGCGRRISRAAAHEEHQRERGNECREFFQGHASRMLEWIACMINQYPPAVKRPYRAGGAAWRTALYPYRARWNCSLRPDIYCCSGSLSVYIPL